jgi:hypothetical protein
LLIFARLEAPALGRGGRGRTGATRGPIRRDKTYLGRGRSAHVAAIHEVRLDAKLH